jgi:hypothetical protein
VTGRELCRYAAEMCKLQEKKEAADKMQAAVGSK